MRALYKPKSKAEEYCEYAVNLYRGCKSGCSYCYVPATLHTTPEQFHSDDSFRVGVLGQLAKDVLKVPSGAEVLMCFSCDPYPENSAATREAIQIIGEAGLVPVILTKNGTRAKRDFDLLKKYNGKFGVSVVWKYLSNLLFEPDAEYVLMRYASLAAAKMMGIYTWASVEPVIDPVEALGAIWRLVPITDMIKIGRWNYDKRADEIDYKDFVRRAQAILGEHPVFWKSGLREFAKEAL